MFLFSYESTSSEESSGEEKPKEEEEEDSSEPEEEAEKPVEGAEAQREDVDVPAAEGGAPGPEQRGERGLLDPEESSELLEEQAEG